MRAVGRHLTRPTTVVVIGGAAAAIEYQSNTKTADIALLAGMSKDVQHASHSARKETGLAIAIGAVTVADLPLNYEDRLRPARGLRIERLRVVFPDKYDLTLSKTVRGYQHDLDAIQGIHRRHTLSQQTLVGRFVTEMDTGRAATGDRRKICLNMAMVVARLWGVEAGRALAERWGVPVPRAE